MGLLANKSSVCRPVVSLTATDTCGTPGVNILTNGVEWKANFVISK